MTTVEIITAVAGAPVLLNDRLDALSIDSLDLCEILHRIDVEQHVTISDRELMSFSTVKDVVTFVAHVQRSEAFLRDARAREESARAAC